MCSTIVKALLVGWLVIGLAVIAIGGVRRSRANRGDSTWMRTARPLGYGALVRGNMSSTPLPDWADWDDETATSDDAKSDE